MTNEQPTMSTGGWRVARWSGVFWALFVCLAFNVGGMAAEQPQWKELRRAYAAQPFHSEADRVRYITELARWRETFTRSQSAVMFAIDDEVRRHAMPEKVDARRLSRLLVGLWASPRRPYWYHADGTWSCNGEQATAGTWRIEGNRFFQNFRGRPEERGEVIILLTAKDFIWGREPFYLNRGRQSHYHP